MKRLGLGTLVYLIVAVVQVPAAVSGIHQLTGLSWFFCVLIGMAFGSTPIFGSLLGIEGAEGGWGWNAGESYFLFVGLPLFFLALGALIGGMKARSHRLNAHNPD
jgi:hypothetical protein